VPEQLDRYEERYRLTIGAALGLASILALVLGIILGLWAILVPIAIVLALLATVVRQAPSGFAAAFAAARRMIAFRADRAGITLGAVPGNPRGGRAAVLVPWTDIQQVVVCPVNPVGRGRYAQVRCIGIQRRPAAPALPEGNEQAPGCPVPDVASGATRRITGWRLDREHLAAVIAAAPGTPRQRLHYRSRPGSRGTGLISQYHRTRTLPVAGQGHHAGGRKVLSTGHRGNHDPSQVAGASDP
jgi:hypothetical protein